jgi:plastocyanin
VDYRQAGRLGAFAEVEAKTPGWVSGNVYLDRNVSVRTGVTVTFRAAGSTPHDVGARRQGSKR